MAVLRTLLDLLRGGLIGVVETIPGVSGGTIALVIGIYDDLIQSAGHLIRGVLGWVRSSIRGTDRSDARAHLAAVRWRVVIPALVGMAVALVLAAKAVEPIVEEHPVETRSLFAGLILASLLVPIRMVSRWRRRDVGYALLALVAGFAFSSIPAADAIEPPLWLVAIAAAIAVCALVMPGVSGSFILLVMGLYAPTLGALNERNWAYIGVFALGAIVGLGAFIPVLQRLLRYRRNVTLAIMTGLMAGSLRALWPWQDASGTPLSPTTEVWPVVGLVVLGAVIVLSLMALERAVVGGRQARELEDIIDNTRDVPLPDAPGR